MCGIFGVVRISADAPSVEPSWLQPMGRALAHRGPDGIAVWSSKHAALGWVRLGIVAPSEPALIYEDGARRKVRSVLNGELYNHRTLRRQLRALGRETRYRSDAALVPLLFREYGPAFVDDIQGPYAIGLFDEGAGRLHLFRDRLGKKPLYYAERGGLLFFASEQKALFATGRVPVEPDPAAAARFMLLGKLDDDRPLFAHVRSLTPGTHLWADRGGVRVAPTWRLLDHAVAAVQDVESPPSMVTDVLRDAVCDRAKTEVPNALLLSGGLDSTLIAHLGKSELSAAYSLRVPEWDESAQAARSARSLRVPHRMVAVRPPSANELERVLWHLEIPDASAGYGMACFFLQLAETLRADGVKVTLSGEGADELFLGYPWDAVAAAVERGSSLPADHWLIRTFGRSFVSAFSLAQQWAHSMGWKPRAFQAWSVAFDPGAAALARERGLRMLSKAIRRGTPAQLLSNERAEGAGEAPLPARGRQLDGLGKDMLALPVLHMDRLMMAAGVEARMPFLDHRLVEIALGLPPKWLERPDQDKPALRAVARQLLPRWRPPPKRGFSARARPEVRELLEMAHQVTREPGLVVDSAELNHALRRGPFVPALLEVLWRAVLLEKVARRMVLGRPAVEAPLSAVVHSRRVGRHSSPSSSRRPRRTTS